MSTRVIAGAHKGRRLLTARGDAVRPTSGRVKEALFSIIGERIENARLLDLFAGTGAIGIEAVSRGASHVTFVESDAGSLKVLNANLQHCGAADTAEVVRQAAEAFLRAARPAYDIVFADPPYRLDSARDLLPALAGSAIIAPHTLVILEHPSKQDMPARVGRLVQRRRYRYGDSSLSVFDVRDAETAA